MMKKIITSFFAVPVIAFGVAAAAWARPPAFKDLNYDAVTKNLHIELDHVTKNPRKHFIRKIEIYKNGEEFADFKYVQQTTSSSLLADVNLEFSPGDIVEVKAVCNESGARTEKLIIPSATSQ